MNNLRGTLSSLFLLGAGAIALMAPVALRSARVNAPALRAALEMMITLFALAGAWLLRTQFTSSRRLRDLQLLAGALVLGLTNLAVAALPAAFDLHGGAYFVVAHLWARFFVGAIFVSAAFMPADCLVARRRHALTIVAGLSLGGLLIAGLGGLTAGIHGTAASITVTSGHPVLVALVVSTTALLVYAAAGFAQRQRAEGDRVAGLVGLALILLAGASFASLLAGALAPGRIGVSEALRTLAFGLILAAAVIRERQVHARISKATALAERRRVARDLHDGIAQDLAFIAAHGPRFAEELGDEHPVVIAARRALAISRSTISELSDPGAATAHEALEAVAHELSARFDITVAVNAELASDLEPRDRENVARIAREAIANAARHGGARNVIVTLRQTRTGVALRVVDDGCGIAGPDLVPAPEGFGLRSMRERAAALGGELNVRQPRMGGTELEVVLP
ncbi:MAG TPA: ATP-binding protein [Solirubrobacteraceae bacterium]|nr:ATP-binding protein [Solirubrobacteraceae bacterium]